LDIGLDEMAQPDRAYFDWNATAPLRAEAREAMLKTLEMQGNASSVHAEGRQARAVVEQARAEVAALVGAQPAQVTFTSGATEANTLALTPAIEADGRRLIGDRLLVSAIEHPSVLGGGRFGRVERLAVTADGLIDRQSLEERLNKAEHPLVSVMLANNETGVVQPSREVADRVHAAGGLLHVDAAQGPGRIDCDINALGADLMTLSAHKFGGPQGVGALIRRSDIHIADQVLKGGGQERGLRAGTEAVAAIAGFGAAARAARLGRDAEARYMESLRNRLESGLRAATPDAVIFGTGARRLPNTTLVARPGLNAETTIIAFDLNGIAVSSGSACSSGKVTPSHVLEAMGHNSCAKSAIRISLGPKTTENDVEKLLEAWLKVTGPVSTLVLKTPDKALFGERGPFVGPNRTFVGDQSEPTITD
jgi:cysteine desulfurase